MTTINISLPDELESRLRERAAASGKDLHTFVREAIAEKLGPAAANGDTTLSPEEIQRRLEAWKEFVAGHAQWPAKVDDSRESIYPDRG